MRKGLLLCAARWVGVPLAAAVSLVSLPAAAEDYPSRSIKLVIGFPTGGNVDVVGRIVAQKMSDGLGRQVIAENKTGAGTSLRTTTSPSDAPDGHTLLMISGAYVTQAATQRQLPYDPIKDFAWVSTLVTYPLVVAVRPDSPFKRLDEFIAYARSNPGKLNYPSPGVGTFYHLAAEEFNALAGIELTHVPFRGGAEPMVEVIAGRMDVLFDALNRRLPADPSAQIAPARHELHHGIAGSAEPSTVARSVPGYEATSCLGIAAPAGTSPAIVERLNREVRRILELPKIRERLSDWGGQAYATSPDELRRYVASEIGKWRGLVDERGIQMQ